MTELQKEQMIISYCENGMKRLKELCNPLIYRKGIHQTDVDYDDLCSLAMEVLLESAKRFDESKGCQFQTFLVGNINKSFYDWTRDRRRFKRCNARRGEDGRLEFIPDCSMDEPGDDGTYVYEKIDSGFRVEDEVVAGLFSDERVETFLKGLGGTKRRLVELLMDGYSPGEVRTRLGISEGKYRQLFYQIKSFDNIRTLRGLFRTRKMNGAEIMEMGTEIKSAEKSKQMQYSIASINKKIENRTIRFDHPLQRKTDQWSPAMKGNLVSDILQGNPLPEIVFAEQIVNGMPVIWDLDGKQRCTICYSFANDGFKVSRNIRRRYISYYQQFRDKRGKLMLDEEGFPVREAREFDIANKYFSQLPEELRDRFLEYTFKCDQYLNCDSDEIAYHIIRYNEGKAMSAPQKGITRIGEEFAVLVKHIAEMKFFQEKGNYTVAEARNGTLERVVVESVMAWKYLDAWNKKQDAICQYLKEHASAGDFEAFETMVARLDKVMTEDVADMFDSKNSFLWFGLLGRFLQKEGKRGTRTRFSQSGRTYGAEEWFLSFMRAFKESLHEREVEGRNWVVLNEKATKDKKSVMDKMGYLEGLLEDWG